jgi:hypothetical protein
MLSLSILLDLAFVANEIANLLMRVASLLFEVFQAIFIFLVRA